MDIYPEPCEGLPNVVTGPPIGPGQYLAHRCRDQFELHLIERVVRVVLAKEEHRPPIGLGLHHRPSCLAHRPRRQRLLALQQLGIIEARNSRAGCVFLVDTSHTFQRSLGYQ